MTAPEIQAALLFYLASINALTFLLSLIDKLAAMNFWRRLPEPFLLTLAVAGGAPASKLAQLLTGHKTLRPDFTIQLNLIVVFHLAVGLAAWSASSPAAGVLALSEIRETASVAEETPKPDLAMPRRFGPGS